MSNAVHRMEVFHELMQTLAQVAQLSKQIARLSQIPHHDKADMDRLAEAWITATLRGRALREELSRLDESRHRETGSGANEALNRSHLLPSKARHRSAAAPHHDRTIAKRAA
jgi:hypothetical protein